MFFSKKWVKISQKSENFEFFKKIIFSLARSARDTFWWLDCYSSFKIGENRINIGEPSSTDITGGYIMRKDKKDNEDPQEDRWSDNQGNNDLSFKDPDKEDLSSEQQTYIKNHLHLLLILFTPLG